MRPSDEALIPRCGTSEARQRALLRLRLVSHCRTIRFDAGIHQTCPGQHKYRQRKEADQGASDNPPTGPQMGRWTNGLLDTIGRLYHWRPQYILSRHRGIAWHGDDQNLCTVCLSNQFQLTTRKYLGAQLRQNAPRRQLFQRRRRLKVFNRYLLTKGDSETTRWFRLDCGTKTSDILGRRDAQFCAESTRNTPGFDGLFETTKNCNHIARTPSGIYRSRE